MVLGAYFLLDVKELDFFPLFAIPNTFQYNEIMVDFA